MNDIRTLFRTLENLIGNEATAPFKWNYEKERAQGKILLPPPHPEISKGEYLLGSVIWNNQSIGEFGLRGNELPQHISIFGRTGSGKTNCSFLFIQELLKKDKPFLIFDWKQSYRVLCNNNPIALYTPGYYQAPFYFNPLDLRNIPEHSREAYLRQLLSVLLNVYFRDLKLLSVEGAEYLILRGLDYLKREKDSFTFLNLYNWILNYKAIFREKDWKSSVLNVLYKLTTGPLGKVLNHEQSINIEEIIKGRTILELHWLGSPKDKSFLMQALLLQLYYYFSQQSSSQKLRFVIIIEEAHNILLRHLEDYETVAEMILRQIREYGVGICLLDQHPSLMSLPALGTYATIAFNLRTFEDLRVMEAALSLEGDKDYLGKLKVGQGIVKLQDRFLKPFLVEFPKAKQFGKEKTDSPTRNGFPQGFPQIRAFSKGDKVFQEKENPISKFLLDVHNFPLSSIIKRYKRLGIGSKQGSELQRQLIQQQLLKPVWINQDKTRIKLLEITEAGKQKLREKGFNPCHPQRRGSLLHQFWCKKAQEHFEKKGYGVLEEIKIGKGKTVDLVAVKENEKIAIEVETGKSDFLENIKKCLEKDFERVVIVATSAKVKKKIKKKIAQEKIAQEKIDVIPIIVVTGSEINKLMNAE